MRSSTIVCFMVIKEHIKQFYESSLLMIFLPNLIPIRTLFVLSGRLQDALGCYERLCVSQGSEEVYKGLLECYLNLDQPHSVLNITQGLLGTRYGTV